VSKALGNNPGKDWQIFYKDSKLNWENKEYYTEKYLHSFLKSEWMLCLTAHLKPGQKILEAGCGTGLYSIALAFAGYEVTAIDYNDVAVELSRSNLELFNSQSEKKLDVNFKKGDLLNLEFPDNTFDLVFNQAVLEYFTDDGSFDKAISEMQRVTVSGGTVVSIIQNTRNPLRPLWNLMGLKFYIDQPNVRSIYRQVLQQYFSRHFKKVRVDGLLPWKAVFMAPKKFHKVTYYLNRFSERFIPLPRVIRSKIGIQLVVSGVKE
jgi:ubiquinone/menaquinone biosynthesis C-methylase UbiE